MISNLVTILISIVNIFVRNFMYSLVNFIGYDTESKRVTIIMRAIFFTVLINTGFLGLIVNANFEYYPVLFFFLPV